MTGKPENPQAYPVGGMIAPSGDYYQDEYGMTLRDYFAGQVDVSVYNPTETFWREYKKNPTIKELKELIVELRYAEADAMLEEGAKQ